MKKLKGDQKYTQLSKEERLEIDILLKKGHRQKDIAEALSRDKSTISREISRNRRRKRTKKGIQYGPYEAKVAKHKSYLRRKNAKYQGRKIHVTEPLYHYIENKLKLGWSPDVISGRMRQEGMPFYASKTSVYEYIYTPRGEPLSKYLYSKQLRRKRRKGKKTKKTLIPHRIGINERPEKVNQNLEYGHYEGDTIVSGKRHNSKYALSVVYERKAKYIDARKIKSLKPAENNRALIRIGQKLIQNQFHTITFDNGIENTRHQELHKYLGIDTYFCAPYSAWQKPGVENANKLIRRFIPKGSDIKHYSPQYIAHHIRKLNHTPRKSLNYQTPYEVMIKNNLLQFKPNKNTPPVALRG